jgi:hypothetical protein
MIGFDGLVEFSDKFLASVSRSFNAPSSELTTAKNKIVLRLTKV